MSELLQEKKTLTFEEICPKWSQRISEGTPIESSELTDSRFCIVGEAWGGSDEYRVQCPQCNRFSGFGNVEGLCGPLRFGEYEIFEQRKEKFVNHFNNVHVK